MYDFQKASMWKRISAALFDFILLSIVIVGMACLLSFAVGFDSQRDYLDEISKTYEDNYNVKFDVNESELTEEEKVRYEEALKARSEDSEYVRTFVMLFNCTVLIVVFSILLGYILMEFIVPLIFKNGQTLGKKIFGIGVMREDGVRISPLLLFIRTVLGKYTLETMLPILILAMLIFQILGIVGWSILLIMFVLQIVLLIFTKARTPLHDKLAHTVTVDFASQMIFDSVEDMIAYKKKIHAEQVESEKSNN